MKKYRLILAFFGLLLGFSACTKGENPVAEGDKVAVSFTAGEYALSLTRAAFAEGVPVTVVAYQHPVDLSGKPYGTFKTTTSVGSSGKSTLVGVDGKPISVLAGHTYDFYAIANPKTELDGGTFRVNHGTDLMAGKTTATITKEQRVVNFGELPHLASQVQFTAQPDEAWAGSISVAVNEVIWSKIPLNGGIKLSTQAAQRLTMSTTYSGNYSIKVIPAAPSCMGVMLPFPLTNPLRDHNRIDMAINLNINGSGISLPPAEDVPVPPFLPGYSYKFGLKFPKPASGDEGKVELYLSIVPWNTTGWISNMGGEDGTELTVLIGSWENVRWSSSMGGDQGTVILMSVGAWRSVSWHTLLGGTNPNTGSNN